MAQGGGVGNGKLRICAQIDLDLAAISIYLDLGEKKTNQSSHFDAEASRANKGYWLK